MNIFKASKWLAVLASLLLAGCAGFNYSKSCSDGVCTIVENGVTRYEGDPEKIARIKEMEARYLEMMQNKEAKYQNMPRRQQHEKIRVGIVFPETNYHDLKPYREQFYQWITAGLSDARFEIIPYKQMRSYLSAVKQEVPVNRGWNESGPRTKREFIPNEASYKKLRDMGLKVDVIVYTSLSPKTQSGLVGGRGQGVGVVSASRIEVSGLVSSIYDFKAFRASQVGKSASKIDIAGIDKDGKKQSASIGNNQRNIQLDKPAAMAYAKALKRSIKAQIANGLPSLAALEAN